MGLEEIVALAAELRDDIVTFEPVQVADATAPVGQVDGVLQGRGGDLCGGRRGWLSFGELGRGGPRRSGSFGGGLGGPQRRGRGTRSGVGAHHLPVVQPHDKCDEQRGQVVPEVEVGHVVEARVLLQQLLEHRVDERDRKSKSRHDAAQERAPEVEPSAGRLAFLGRRSLAPVREPHGSAHREQRDADAQRVLPVERADADHRRLGLLGQGPQHLSGPGRHRG